MYHKRNFSTPIYKKMGPSESLRVKSHRFVSDEQSGNWIPEED
jgi:hypothetical protein